MDPVSFAEHLPEVFREDDLVRRFLAPFEVVLAEVRAELGGSAAGTGGPPRVFRAQRAPPPDIPAPQPPPPPGFSSPPAAPAASPDSRASWMGLPLRAEKPAEWNRR